MKRFLILIALGLLSAVACDDQATKVGTSADKADGATMTNTQPPGTCNPSKCPKPTAGIPCCTPNADCGMDPTGVGLTCLPNPETGSSRECKRDGDKVFSDGKECTPPPGTLSCCTALGGCGWDPFASGLICFANPPPPPPPPCDITTCPTPDGGAPPCCLLNGACGTFALPGIPLCFPPPPPPLPPTCDITKCPADAGGGLKSCCLPTGQCGVDAFENGFCLPPPAAATCDLAACPRDPSGFRSCCLPNGNCGVDTLGIGACFLPPLPPPDYTKVPDHPTITNECPSFIGAFGYPVWGCCQPVGKYGVCGQFQGNQCLLAPLSGIPTGPPPAEDSGITENFLRCKPPVLRDN